LTKFNVNDHIPTIGSMRTTVCWRPLWNLRPYRLQVNPALTATVDEGSPTFFETDSHSLGAD